MLNSHSTDGIIEWMTGAGFQDVSVQQAERIIVNRKGRDVLSLSKDFTSQLSLLPSQEYINGMKRLKSAVCEAEAFGEPIVFPVDISLLMVSGRKMEGEEDGNLKD